MERVLILERIDVALEGNIRTEKKEGGDRRMDGEKKVYGRRRFMQKKVYVL